MSDRYEYVPIEELTAAKSDPCHVYRNFWWTVEPGKGALFFRIDPRDDPVPQCNPDRYIVERMLASRGSDTVEAVQIPIAFVPHRCEP